MKLQDVILKALAKKITWIEAAEIAGMSVRNMQRMRQRYQAALRPDVLRTSQLYRPSAHHALRTEGSWASARPRCSLALLARVTKRTRLRKRGGSARLHHAAYRHSAVRSLRASCNARRTPAASKSFAYTGLPGC